MFAKNVLPTQDQALPSRSQPLSVIDTHYVNKHSIKAPFPENTRKILLAMGCFWGAERKFWQLDGVYVTAVGYAGGFTPNPTYEEVCSGGTGHTEVVLVVYENTPEVAARVFQTFWEAHDPTQGMRQGNDRGTQYRSAIYTCSPEQEIIAEATQKAFQEKLSVAGFDEITTEIAKDKDFYYAESYHQQYLAKNPNGYCGLGGTGVRFE